MVIYENRTYNQKNKKSGGYTARALGFPIFNEGGAIEEIEAKVKDAYALPF